MNEFDETLTFDEVVERYEFSQKDIDKIMKRTKPETEIEGIRVLYKEGERRAKLKAAYAKKRLESVESDIVEEMVPTECISPVVNIKRTFLGFDPITGESKYSN